MQSYSDWTQAPEKSPKMGLKIQIKVIKYQKFPRNLMKIYQQEECVPPCRFLGKFAVSAECVPLCSVSIPCQKNVFQYFPSQSFPDDRV